MKIIIDKKEGIAEVADRLLNVEDGEITLVIPRNTQLLDSPTNFRLLAHEAETLGKDIIIESVDEEVLAAAKAHDLEAVHPLFGEKEQGHRAMSDIVPPAQKNNADAPQTADEHSEETSRARAERPQRAQAKQQPHQKKRKRFSGLSLPAWSKRWVGIGVLIIIVLGLVGWGVASAFGSATVVLRFNKVPWEFQGSITAAPNISTVSADENRIPGEHLESEKNTTQFFAASGREQVERKAQGRITIYNTFSSQPQPLVATTRFLTPDGKLFRLVDQVTVPGAKIENGDVVPSSISATVVADQPGEEFNVGPTERLTIPGFKESGLTARYEGFYGALHDGASGGFVGETAVPTDEDIARARERVRESLLSSFEVSFLNRVPDELKILDEAKEITVVDLTVNEETNEEDKFSILGRARFRAMAFKESDLKELLAQQLDQNFTGWDLEDISVEYRDIEVDLENKTLTFDVSAQAVRVPEFDEKQFTNRIIGKGEDDARELIRQLPELTNATLQLWPAWIQTVPSSPEDVSVTVE